MTACIRCGGAGHRAGYIEQGGQMAAVPEDCQHCDGTGIAPRIAGSALRTPEGVVVSLPAPARHHDVIRHMGEIGYTREQIARCDQGFVTDREKWIRRPPALRIAEVAGQIVRGPTAPAHGLFSEDVW